MVLFYGKLHVKSFEFIKIRALIVYHLEA